MRHALKSVKFMDNLGTTNVTKLKEGENHVCSLPTLYGERVGFSINTSSHFPFFVILLLSTASLLYHYPALA